MNRCIQSVIAISIFTSACVAQVAERSSPAVSAPELSKGQWTVRGHIPFEQFVIYSHRGAGELAPENTIAAFELGWKMGTVPEADMRTTRDGILVAFHDASFKRIVNTTDAALKKQGVSDLTFAELSKLDVGSWNGDQFAGLRVPKLSEVFALMRGQPERRLCLDYKHVDLKHLAEEVRSHGVEQQTILATTDYEVIREWKKLLPGSVTMLWMSEPETRLKVRLEQLRAVDFAGINRIQFHPRANTNSASIEPFTLSRSFLRAVADETRSRRIVFEVFPRDITDPKAYWQLLDLGVASFSTDHPQLTIKAVRDYYARE